MPLVHYYLGRPASVWIAAMSKRSSAQRPRTGTEPARAGNPGQPASARQPAPPSPRRGRTRRQPKKTGDERPC
jgi:hypothetical protein